MRAAVFLTGREHRRKAERDGGEWVEEELKGGAQQRRYPAADW